MLTQGAAVSRAVEGRLGLRFGVSVPSIGIVLAVGVALFAFAAEATAAQNPQNVHASP